MISAARYKMRRLVRFCRRRFTTGAVILLYHRVMELPSDPYLLSVSPNHFAEQLDVLRRESRPLSLRQLTDSLRNGKIPRRAAVITFDDGYFDNLIYAKPLLDQYNTPATVFVAPGFLPANADEFWWDALEKIFLQPRSLPQKLSLFVRGTAHEWQLGSAADYSPADHARHRLWNYAWADDPTPRHTVFRSVHQLLKSLDTDERREVLDALMAWACADPAVRPSHRLLSAGEIVQLVEGGLVEIGAHTMTHSVLSALPLAKQQAEIRQSKTYLEQVVGRPVTSFAYPHGLPADYTQETVALVRESGFQCACAANPGMVRCGVDVHQLPRFVVRDEDGETFAQRLSSYFY